MSVIYIIFKLLFKQIEVWEAVVTFLLFPTQVYLAYLVDRGRFPFGLLCNKSRISSSSTVEKADDEEVSTTRTTLRSTISGSQSSGGDIYTNQRLIGIRLLLKFDKKKVPKQEVTVV